MNKENFRLVLDEITAHPENWNQESWHCGSAHCFLGHAQIMAGKPQNEATTFRDARIFLGLNRLEALYVAHWVRTLRQLKDFVRFGDANRAKFLERQGLLE